MSSPLAPTTLTASSGADWPIVRERETNTSARVQVVRLRDFGLAQSHQCCQDDDPGDGDARVRRNHEAARTAPAPGNCRDQKPEHERQAEKSSRDQTETGGAVVRRRQAVPENDGEKNQSGGAEGAVHER